jgi:hypothetical protein
MLYELSCKRKFMDSDRIIHSSNKSTVRKNLFIEL